MRKRLKILFLAHLFPLPLDSGGKIKSYYTLSTLAQQHDVHVVAYTRTKDELDRLAQLNDVCSSMDTVPLSRTKLKQLTDVAHSVASGQSFIVSRDYRDDMQAAVNRAVDEFEPDALHIDHLQMAQFVNFSGPYGTVLDHHNVESTIIKRVGESRGGFICRVYANLEWPKLQRYELEICEKCDTVITVSEEDKQTLQDMQPRLRNIYAVPIGTDIHHFQTVDRDLDSTNILSIATMYWPPNVDSMHYFYESIFPLIRKKLPECILTIAGQRPVKSILALKHDANVRVTGYVPDSMAVAKDCGVFIVPLRSGSGVRVKILNAMAMGLPIVSTSIGAEGLDVVSGEHLLIADTPEDFCKAVISVLADRKLSARLSHNARQLVCEKYSWESIGKQLLNVYEDLAGRL